MDANISRVGELEGRVAWVTGAGSGIGAATALSLADSGARVLLLDRNANGLAAVTEQMRGQGRNHRSVVVDVSDAAALENAVQPAGEEWQKLDIVVAAAGINGVWAPLDEITAEEWDHTLAVNLRGTFLTLKLAVPLMRKTGGSIVIVSSINGTRMFSNSGATAYACSKAAQIALMKMTALELAKDGIRVNAVCPGSVDTQINQSTNARNLDTIRQPFVFPWGEIPLTGEKPATVQQVARLIHFLASDAANHISGTEVFLDGAQSLLRG